MSPIFKTFEFCRVWGYEKRGKKVVRADSCIATRPYIAEVVPCLCLWLHEGLRVRGHGSSHWNNFSSAAWDSLICLLYYLCKNSCFSALFLVLPAWNVIKKNLVQNNHSHTSNRLRMNFLISFNVKNTRASCERTDWKCWLWTNPSNIVSLFSKVLEDTWTMRSLCFFKDSYCLLIATSLYLHS